jgi:hypothetical protein
MIGIAMLAYLLIGAAVAWLVDRAQMDKDVPYGEFPSLLPLRQLRAVVAVTMVVCGAALVVYYFPRLIVNWFRVRAEIDSLRRKKDKYLA